MEVRTSGQLPLDVLHIQAFQVFGHIPPDFVKTISAAGHFSDRLIVDPKHPRISKIFCTKVPFSGSAVVITSPFYGAEPGLAKQGVKDADGSNRLVTVSPVGILRIPDGRAVLDT
jgi:hypothetical protein